MLQEESGLLLFNLQAGWERVMELPELPEAERLKRDYGINPLLREEQWWENTQIDGRCDVVLDLVGGGETFEMYMSRSHRCGGGSDCRCANRGSIGSTLIRRARLIGTVLRSRTDEEKHIVPAVRRRSSPRTAVRKIAFPNGGKLPQLAVEEAHRKVASNQTFGKVIVTGPIVGRQHPLDCVVDHSVWWVRKARPPDSDWSSANLNCSKEESPFVRLRSRPAFPRRPSEVGIISLSHRAT